MVCDGRVTSEDGWIYTDTDRKGLQTRGLSAVCAGSLGSVWDSLLAQPPKSLDELRERLVCDKPGHVYEVLASDGRGIYLIDQTGAVLQQGQYATIGSGGAVALGALDVMATPKSLKDAELQLRTAVRVAIRRVSSCGGRVRTYRVRLG